MKTSIGKGEELAATFLQVDGPLQLFIGDLFLTDFQHGTAKINPHHLEFRWMPRSNFQGNVGGPGGDVLRTGVLVLLGAGPFLAGAVHEPVFIPLLAGCALAGLAWRARHRRARTRGVTIPRLPGGRLLVALHLLVLFQLLPLPPVVLRLVSPGSFTFYNDHLLVPLTAWRPISVSPPDTLRGLAFLVAFSLLYATVFHELASRRWRRRLMLLVVGVGLAITVVALVQAVSPEPRKRVLSVKLVVSTTSVSSSQ